ncbi:TerL protein [Burkholderia cenocepacia]|uniref:TerL protein n=1 Tax=Burkholderia cenocepacia TaxID=95486 RepID=UPI0022383CE1|nr:TerL protein [Burkholderia cenocepacia]MCW5141068.1 TerL protein [Burkholderia cenocepacia]
MADTLPITAAEMYPGFDWLNPDYDAVLARRTVFVERMRAHPETVEPLKAFFAENPVAFINMFGMTFDPRNVEIKLPSIVPFVMFPKQEEFVDWIVERWRARDDGLAEKSRDMGASWLCVAVAVWMWLFHAGTVVGFGSRKEEYVDKAGDPKSLLWKARQFIAMLPAELQPDGYVEREHAPQMRILNPANGATIIGESGDNIGRGNRTSIYFKDESAFYERPEAIDAALSMTSNCKIDISTPNGNGNPFYRKRHGGKIPVFTLHWTDDPRKNREWYDRQCAKEDAVTVAQEIDIDYNASVSNAWISGDLVAAAQRVGPADVVAVGEWIVGVDAAHFGNDESVIHRRRGRLNLPQITKRKLDGVQLAGVVEEECDALERSGVAVFSIVIELDGPGVSCYDQLRLGPYAERVAGVHTGAKQSTGRNFNLRAKAWRGARDYLADGPVSMPADPELKSQLASVKYQFRDGALLIQSKKEYKAEFGKSPDRADAFILTFLAPTEEARKPQAAPAVRVPVSSNLAWMA